MKTERIPILNNAYMTTYLNDNYKETKRPAVIICPGGGYILISENESKPVALRFKESGYQAFVLNYSIKEQARFEVGIDNLSNPVRELSETIGIIKSNASRWGVDPSKIIVCGFSAGGHVASSLCSVKEADFLKPNALILSYPLIDYRYLNKDWKVVKDGQTVDLYKMKTEMIFGNSEPTQKQFDSFDVKNHIHNDMPPIFIWHARQDRIIPFESTVKFAEALKNSNVDYELHLFEKGIHGNPFYENEWFELSLKWMERVLI